MKDKLAVAVILAIVALLFRLCQMNAIPYHKPFQNITDANPSHYSRTGIYRP
jgi:hypothetical protein